MPPAAPPDPVEHYEIRADLLVRRVRLASGRVVESTVTRLGDSTGVASTDYQRAWLRQGHRPPPPGGGTLYAADLFSGCGGLSLGLEEAAHAVGARAVTAFAVERETRALAVFEANFKPEHLHDGVVQDVVDRLPGERRLSAAERRLRELLPPLDVLVAGPPCQGHSDLNNHTRRADPKNSLYLTVARFAEVTRPAAVIIENVPGVVHDKLGVVPETRRALQAQGYRVDDGVLRADEVGAPQRRRRHFLIATRLVATRAGACPLDSVRAQLSTPALTVDEAIGDLGTEPARGVFGTSARHSERNRARIDYLFDRQIHDLPDELRPDCHRLKEHSYTAVYGRMHGDRPAPTITAGFGSTGQGRFVHPHEPRTLTPHEAARLQGFPDWFDFSAASGRRVLQSMIGNAVPSRLSYAVLLSVLRRREL